MNVLIAAGNLGGDARVNNVSGTAVANFSVPMKSGYGDREQTIWVNCSLWGKQAESRLVDYLKKGQHVTVTGEMGTREYEGKTQITMRVDRITLGGGRSNGDSGQQSTPPQPTVAQQPQKQAAQNYASDPDMDDDSIPF